jgi:hypothetical protein
MGRQSISTHHVGEILCDQYVTAPLAGASYEFLCTLAVSSAELLE